MSDTKIKSAIVVGVGPVDGLGAQLAIRFAKKSLHVFVVGRTPDKLAAVVEAIESEGGNGTAVRSDATNEGDVKSVFDLASNDEFDLKLVIYNTGNNTPGQIAEMEASYFEYSWRVCCFGGFLYGRGAVQAFGDDGGVLLFTGASASMRGRPNFGAFNSSKAALRILAQAMAKECGPHGIHVGHVVVDGAIAGEKIKKGIPAYAEKLGEAGMVNIQGIVDAYEFLYNQPANAWSFEIDVRTSIERW